MQTILTSYIGPIALYSVTAYVQRTLNGYEQPPLKKWQNTKQKHTRYRNITISANSFIEAVGH